MANLKEFDDYLEHLCGALGYRDRDIGLKDYCRRLIMLIKRRSSEPWASQPEPLHAATKHQSLHHFIAKSDWSDEAVLGRVRDWVLPLLGVGHGSYWVIGDMGFPKKGKHSVGVARQYCGQLGKQDNCQVAVSLLLASEHGSLPIAYQLYLPKAWAGHPARRKLADVPGEVEFATKPGIALAQIRAAFASGVPRGVVLADAEYGDETAFRDGITGLGMHYVVGIHPKTAVWAGSRTAPLPPQSRSSGEIRPARLHREPGHHRLVSTEALAMELPAQAWRAVTWREGTDTELSSRFAALRVRAAHRDTRRSGPRPEEWLLIEWPEGKPEPTKYVLSTVPADAPPEQLACVTKMRWRIERCYQELKQEFGQSYYEGRGWRGFHHHATLCIAVYGFLVAQRLGQGVSEKNAARPQTTPALAGDDISRGSPTSAATCAISTADAVFSHHTSNHDETSTMSALQ